MEIRILYTAIFAATNLTIYLLVCRLHRWSVRSDKYPKDITYGEYWRFANKSLLALVKGKYNQREKYLIKHYSAILYKFRQAERIVLLFFVISIFGFFAIWAR